MIVQRRGPFIVVAMIVMMTALPLPLGWGFTESRPGSPNFGSHATDSAIDVIGDLYRRDERVRQAPAALTHPVLREYTHAELCNVSSATLTSNISGSCAPADGAAPAPACDGGDPIMPLWRRDRASETAPWGPWTFATGWSCPEDVLPTMTAADFRQLPIAPQVIQMQPDRGWVLVNKETIVLTDAAEQTFRTDLFGYGVDVIATPTRYSWDFNDGSKHLTTDSPGKPYPAFDVFHVYSEPATTSIELTTTWSGRYRIDGDTTWREVVGTAETVSASEQFEVVERRSHLVAEDCLENPGQPGCG